MLLFEPRKKIKFQWSQLDQYFRGSKYIYSSTSTFNKNAENVLEPVLTEQTQTYTIKNTLVNERRKSRENVKRWTIFAPTTFSSLKNSSHLFQCLKENKIDIFGEHSTSILKSFCLNVFAECQLGSAAGAQMNTLERTNKQTHTLLVSLKRFQMLLKKPDAIVGYEKGAPFTYQYIINTYEGL